ncbi:MAG: TonB-dependent receptor domain-containing protein [Mangrovibacterium sp.]
MGKFEISGIQANVSYQFESFSTWFNYTFCDPRQTYAETGAVDNRVGDIAKHQFNIGVNKLFYKKLNVNLRTNFTGNRKVGTGTTVPLNTASFPSVAIFNGAVSYSNPEILKGIEFQLVCNNLLDKEYYHPGTKAADGINSPTEILQRDRHFVLLLRYIF